MAAVRQLNMAALDQLSQQREDVRALLRFILHAHEAGGGQIVRPVGCTGLEDWLLVSLWIAKAGQGSGSPD